MWAYIYIQEIYQGNKLQQNRLNHRQYFNRLILFNLTEAKNL
jgi:hypothetical protein